ncbi:AvrE-family type 3 secretion system effector [Pseudomonas mucidolens]|uniref:AvrE-family type 3 secretion system effector n=1 Tax=Pseudomonas mucidolens TaxID=46679 RepID=UPI000A02A6C1|nr:AvrE-family type 3 secretion system effector [Pseudomonas mucidolens]SQH31893.1 putative type III secreted protein [Pseudomonas mucidolens]
MHLRFEGWVGTLRNTIDKSAARPAHASSRETLGECLPRDRGIAKPLSKKSTAAAAIELTRFQSLRPTSMLFGVTLEHGRVQADATLAGQDIARHLNQASPHYVADDLGGDAHTLRLTYGRQRVLYLHSTPAVAAVINSSRTADSGPAPDNPGRAHLGPVSQVQTTLDGKQYRLEQGRLFRFEPQTDRWLADADTRLLNRIGLTAQGQLLKMPQGVADSSVEGNNVLCLSHVEGASVLSLQGVGEQSLSPLDESGRPLQLTRIGLAGDTLYGCTVQGELFRGSREQARDGQLPMTWQPLESLEQALSGEVSVEGFFHADGGQLNALIRDAREQLHSCPLIEPHALRPEWNLSDALVKGIEQGLPQPSLQALASAIDLGPRGKVTCDEGNLLCWDARSQRWEDSSQGVERMARGLDGRAYVLQEGQLKAVTSQQVCAPSYEGASYMLSGLAVPRTQATLDEVMAQGPSRITGFAVEDGRSFVTLDEHGRLQAQLDGRVQPLTFTQAVTAQALALDAEANLYAHSKGGELFRVARADWQGAGHAALSWTRIILPKAQRLDSLRMGADKQLIGGWAKAFHRLEVAADGALTWGAVQPSTPAPGVSLAEKMAGTQWRGVVLDGTVSVGSNVLGQASEGVPLKRNYLQGLKAHFHPIESLRQAGRDIQHHFNGRQGLAQLYADDKRLHAQLKPLAHAVPVAGGLGQRLAALCEAGPRQALARDIGAALERVENNSETCARRLGEVHGMWFDPRPQLSRATVQPDSTVHQLYEAFKRLSPSPDKTTALLLANFEGQALNLPARDPERKRDSQHPSALLVGDLIHHAATLKQLGDLVLELEQASGHSPSAMARVEQSLGTLMQQYAQSPVHKLSSQNIVSHGQAESIYDNFKLLAKDLGTPGSALHWHLSGVLGLAADASLKEAMTREVRQLESGQKLAPSRTHGKSFGMMLTGIKTVSPVAFFVGVSKAHANGISISRTDSGARIEISMDDTRRVATSIASGTTLGRGEGALGTGLRVGAELTAAVARTHGASISFDVKEADFAKMMAILTAEQGNVYDLLDLGAAHVTGESAKTHVDLHLDLVAQQRLLYNPQENISEIDSVVRAGVGLVGNLNLAHADLGHSVSRSSTSTTHGRSANVQLLRQGGVGANVVPFNAAALGHLQDGGSSIAAFALPEMSVMVRLDRSQSRSFSFSFKQPEALEPSQIDELVQRLSRYSPAYRADLAAVELTGRTPGEQLAKLQQFFATHSPLPTRLQAYQAIAQLVDNLTHQHDLQQHQLRQLAAVETSVTRIGLNDDERHAWLDDVAPANKAAIVQWLNDAPQFAQMLGHLKSGEGTSVSVSLELKPQVLRSIERECFSAGRKTPLIEQALNNRDNLRIKSLSLAYSASRSHAMAFPPMSNLGFSSTAGLSYSQKRLSAEFEYGADADKPLKMKLDDRLGALPSHDLTLDLADARVRTPRSPIA